MRAVQVGTLVPVGVAARRTGLAGGAAQMRQVCAARGVPVVAGRVDLAAFDGGACEVDLGYAMAVVARGRI